MELGERFMPNDVRLNHEKTGSVISRTGEMPISDRLP
jgi:hypothetical protein